MSQDLQNLVESGKITKQTLEKLHRLEPGTYVTHKSWGFGKISGYDLVTSQVLIDFKGKPGHPMQLAYAADSLVPLPPEHILVTQATDPEGLRKLAQTDSAAFLAAVLKSFPDRQATAAQIEPLFKDFFKPEEFKKVMAKVRADLKKNPHFILPAAKTAPFVLRDEPVDHKTELLEKFRDAVGIKPVLSASSAILAEIELFKGDTDALNDMIFTINQSVEKNVGAGLIQAIELAMVRDDLRAAADLPGQDTLTVELLLLKSGDIAAVFRELPNSRARQLLAALKAAHPADWDKLLLPLANGLEGSLVDELFEFFKKEGKVDVFSRHIDKLVREHSISSALILWLSKNRPSELASLLNIRLANAIIATCEREQFKRDGRVGGRLHDLLLDDKKLLLELIEKADLEEAKDLLRNLQISPAFEELNKRSLLARIIKTFPETQALVSTTGGKDGEAPRGSGILYVSWSSLAKRKDELDHLINVKIPANVKEIEIAKGYGDLRENHEFKAAKEMQKVLGRRRAELEDMLDRAQGVDFSQADTAQVNIGCIVEVEDTASGKSEVFSVLGAWDSAPEKGIISYQTPVGQALLYKKIGDSAQLPAGESTRTVVIRKIAAFTGEI